MAMYDNHPARPDEAGSGRTVLIWVRDTFDVFMAQQIVKAVSRSIGLDPAQTLLQIAEVSEKGAGFTAPGTNGGLLVINAHGTGAEAGLCIRTVDTGRSEEALTGERRARYQNPACRGGALRRMVG